MYIHSLFHRIARPETSEKNTDLLLAVVARFLSIALALFLPLLSVLSVLSGSAQAQVPTPALASAPRQEPSVIRQTVEDFLRVQSVGLPGVVAITVGQLDPRMNLSACAAPEPFLPPGSRVWGKTTVGVRCTAPLPWTIYLQATVSVSGEYVATATAISQGQIINASDLVKVKGDLASLPAAMITDPAQAIGRTLTVSLPSGTPLRLDVLRNQVVIQQGQVVRIVAKGPGFSVSGEGRALSNAGEGQMVQVRSQAGQQISGVAKAGGIVEVAYRN